MKFRQLNTVTNHIANSCKQFIFVTLSFMLIVGGALAETNNPLEVEVVNVSNYDKLKNLEFVGIITIGGLIDISAPTSGIVTEFNNELGKSMQASERLAAIKNLDELYNDVVIKSPDNNIRILRTFVEKGNFVEKHQRMMVLAKDVYYEANVQLVASEVGLFKQPQDIEVIVHPNTKLEQSFNITESRIEIPDQQNFFYNARLKLACPKTSCEDTALAGAIVKLTVKKAAEIHISPDALLQNGKVVAVINQQGIVELRQIVKGKTADDYVEVLQGLKLNEQLVVGYSRPPKEGEKVLIITNKSSHMAAL